MRRAPKLAQQLARGGVPAARAEENAPCPFKVGDVLTCISDSSVSMPKLSPVLIGIYVTVLGIDTDARGALYRFNVHWHDDPPSKTYTYDSDWTTRFCYSPIGHIGQPCGLCGQRWGAKVTPWGAKVTP